MHVIMKGKYYVQLLNNNRPSLITNVNRATRFSEKAAINFINNQIKPKDRSGYRVVGIDNVQTISPPVARDILNDLGIVKSRMQNEYNEILTGLYKDLEKCDNEILDLRHYIRDDGTRLNAYQGYMIFKNLQQMERNRVAIKIEIGKINNVIEGIQALEIKTKDFHFEPYKPRVVKDSSRFIS